MSSCTDAVGSLIAIADTSSTLRLSRSATCPRMTGLVRRDIPQSVWWDNDKFRLPRTGSWRAKGGGQNTKNAEISHHCGGDPAASVTHVDCVAECEPEEVSRIDAGRRGRSKGSLKYEVKS